MFDKGISFYFIAYLLEVLFANLLFCTRLKRKRNFVLRAAAALVLYGIAGYFLPLLVGQAVSGFRSITVMTVALGCLLLCYDHKFKDILFCLVAASAVENLASNLEMMLMVTLDIPFNSVYQYLLIICAYGAVYSAVYFLCARRLKKEEPIGLDNFVILGIALSTTVIVTFLQFWLMNEGLDRMIVTRIPYAALDIMALFIQFGFLERTKLRQEKVILEQLLLKEGKQYEISKRNIEVINMKCHDLKNQVSALNVILQQDQLEEIADALMIYDHIAKTGNKALDIILFEKSLLCEQNRITFSYMVDGERLRELNPLDIASVFGNAIDNAIECVKHLEEEKRIISLQVMQKDDLLSIHIENYCETLPEFKNGIPISTKGDDDYHGFGVKSIQYVVEKYNGTLAIEAANNLYGLNILLPAGS